MAFDRTGSFWQEFLHGWPMAVKIGLGITTVIMGMFLTFLMAFLVYEGNRDIEIGLSGLKATRSETTTEKNCRVLSQEVTAWSQRISNEIAALEAQVVVKDHDLSEIRQKCLVAPANTPHFKDESRCRTEVTQSDGWMTTSATPRNDYETELNSVAEERNALKSRITAKEQERDQRQQRLSQRCLGAENHAP